MNFIEVLSDRKLLGQFLGDDPSTWSAWFTFAKCFFALPPGPDDLPTFTKCTGRTAWPTVPAKEAWIVAGRRSGKSRFVSLIAAFYAIQKYRLAAGERANIIIASPSLNQSKILRRYLSGIFTDNAMLRSLVVKENAQEIVLRNNVAIIILSGDFRTVRGFGASTVIVDEVGYLSSEGETPDTEILRALRPALANTSGPLICISSPFTKRGELWKAYRDHYGKDNDPVLVWQADSLTMNPTLNR